MDNVTPELMHAVATSLGKKAKAGRTKLTPGKKEVSGRTIVHFRGSVNVSEDETYTPTTSVPTKAALALFMKYSGCTGPAAMKTLEKAMRDAAQLDDKAAKKLSEMADIEETEKKVKDGLDRLPKETRKGKVTVSAGDVMVHELSWDEE